MTIIKRLKRAVLKKLQIGKSPVVVMGNPHSGTSWIGKTLGQAPEALFCHGLSNPVVNGSGDMSIIDRYVRKEINDLQLSTLLDEAFSGLPSIRME